MLRLVIVVMVSAFLFSCNKASNISPGKYTLVSKNPAVTGELFFRQDQSDKTSYEFSFVNAAKTQSVLGFSTKIDSSGKADYESDRQQYKLDIQISGDTITVKQDGMAGFDKDISYAGEYKKSTN